MAASHRGFYVQLLAGDGATHVVDCAPSDTAAGVKRRALQQRAVAAGIASLHRRRLAYNGAVLDDAAPLMTYGIPRGGELLVLEDGGDLGGDALGSLRGVDWQDAAGRAARACAAPIDRLCLPLRWGYPVLFLISILFGPALLGGVAGMWGGSERGACSVVLPAQCPGAGAATTTPAVARFAAGVAPDATAAVWRGALPECELHPAVADASAGAPDVCTTPVGGAVPCVMYPARGKCVLPPPPRTWVRWGVDVAVRAALFSGLLFAFVLAWVRVLASLRTSLAETYSVPHHPNVRKMDAHGYTPV
eukprot:TRINITY_DN32924_c0_g1_i1.p1 TRINITY_DN32924_c0_g1~~TRINITY_DN32924_c0_g1_i1.p1  ORF type:complete len:322 (+),score=87.79 TRINITY_DN32924_c0_g1_i1:52-966(+)